MGKYFFWVGVLSLGLVVFGWRYYPDRDLKIISCDVGQGDAILIQEGFTQVIIDGGPGNRILKCLGKYMPFWDRRIEVVMMTHPQADHMTGLIDVFARYKVGVFVASGVLNKGEGLNKLRLAVVNEGSEVILPNRGDALRVGKTKYEVVWPVQEVGERQIWTNPEFNPARAMPEMFDLDDPNKISLVLKLERGKFSGLFTGDVGISEEQALVSSKVLTDVTFLKVAHHGSKYSTSTGFLGVVKPDMAVISVGAKNGYGHPSSDTLMRLDVVGAKIMRTDELGDVVVTSDGEKWWVE